MAQLGVQIYGEHEIFRDALREDPTDSWSREEWQKKLREVVPTPEAWMGMTVASKRLSFKPYGGKGLRRYRHAYSV
jgi:hypothetical protein